MISLVYPRQALSKGSLTGFLRELGRKREHESFPSCDEGEEPVGKAEKGFDSSYMHNDTSMETWLFS